MSDLEATYLEKTLFQNPSDVAHLLKYLYWHLIRFDTKNWFHFTDHKWHISEIDDCPLLPIIKNDLVNKYLTLASHYNQQIVAFNKQLATLPGDLCPQNMTPGYLPLIISDLTNKSRLCSELSLKLNNTAYQQKIILSAQEIFTTKNFPLFMNQNPNLIGFNNGIYHLDTKTFDLALPQHKVIFSAGYDYMADLTPLHKEVLTFFTVLGLTPVLPSIASLLSGNYRQPLIWITNLTDDALYAITQLLLVTLGDYIATLPFSVLRKRKIPSPHTHTHTQLINSCNKRLLLVEQKQDDYPNVFPPMIDTLLSSNTLNLRRPRELNHRYQPQFGLMILSSKKDCEPMDGALVFNAKEIYNIQSKDEWKLDFIKLLLAYR